MAGPFLSGFIKSPAPRCRSARARSIPRSIASKDEDGSRRGGAHQTTIGAPSTTSSHAAGTHSWRPRLQPGGNSRQQSVECWKLPEESVFSDWILRLRALFKRAAVEQDIDDELR